MNVIKTIPQCYFNSVRMLLAIILELAEYLEKKSYLKKNVTGAVQSVI